MVFGPERAAQGHGPDGEHPGEEPQAGEGEIHHIARPPGAVLSRRRGRRDSRASSRRKRPGTRKGGNIMGSHRSINHMHLPEG